MTATRHTPSRTFVTARRRLAFGDAVAGLVLMPDGRYLMQLRDDRGDIFYPDHWGLFGGSVDPGESPIAAIRRELEEEIGVVPRRIRFFLRSEIDYRRLGSRVLFRNFYEVRLSKDEAGRLRLGEGAEMRAFRADVLLQLKAVVPYDSYAVWLHAFRRRFRARRSR